MKEDSVLYIQKEKNRDKDMRYAENVMWLGREKEREQEK